MLVTKLRIVGVRHITDSFSLGSRLGTLLAAILAPSQCGPVKLVISTQLQTAGERSNRASFVFVIPPLCVRELLLTVFAFQRCSEARFCLLDGSQVSCAYVQLCRRCVKLQHSLTRLLNVCCSWWS